MFEFNVAVGWSEILNGAKNANKTVVVNLKTGPAYKGKVKDVGDHSIVLTELSENTFSDVIFRIDDIVSVEARIR